MKSLAASRSWKVWPVSGWATLPSIIMAILACCITRWAKRAEFISSALASIPSGSVIVSLIVGFLPFVFDLGQQEADQPSQSSFYVNRFEDGLPLNGSR